MVCCVDGVLCCARENFLLLSLSVRMSVRLSVLAFSQIFLFFGCRARVCVVSMVWVAMVCVDGVLCQWCVSMGSFFLSLTHSVYVCVCMCGCECESMALMVSMVLALAAVIVVVAVLVSVKNFVVVVNFGRFTVCPSVHNFRGVHAQARKQRSVHTIACDTNHATILHQQRHTAYGVMPQAISKHAVWPLHTLPPTSMYLS